MTRVAVLGLGEAGHAIAADLVAAGETVVGYDPADVDHPAGVDRCGNVEQAARGADVVLILVPGRAAVDVAQRVAPALAERTLYVDCTTSSPAAKRAAAAVVRSRQADFVDLALMGTVPGAGIHVPCLLAGPGAERMAEILRGWGSPAEAVSRRPGVATERKLLRSIFMKGLAAVIGEALDAAEAAGCGPWLREHVEDQLLQADAALVERLLTGTVRHAARRVDEMEAAVELLHERGVPDDLTAATVRRLRRLADG